MAYRLELIITKSSRKNYDIALRSMHGLSDYMEESPIDYPLLDKLDA